MRFFDEVSPVKLQCPCGTVTESEKMTDKYIFELVNNNRDTLFMNLKCGHNPLFSQCVLTDKNGNMVQKMSKERFGFKRYYLLKIYLALTNFIKNYLLLLQWFCPIYSEILSIRYWGLWLAVSATLFFLHINPLYQMLWFFGFQFFGWIFAIWIGVFNID